MDKREERKLKKHKKRQERIAREKTNSGLHNPLQKKSLHELGRVAIMIIAGVVLGMVILLNLVKS